MSNLSLDGKSQVQLRLAAILSGKAIEVEEAYQADVSSALKLLGVAFFVTPCSDPSTSSGLHFSKQVYRKRDCGDFNATCATGVNRYAGPTWALQVVPGRIEGKAYYYQASDDRWYVYAYGDLKPGYFYPSRAYAAVDCKGEWSWFDFQSGNWSGVMTPATLTKSKSLADAVCTERHHYVKQYTIIETDDPTLVSLNDLERREARGMR